MTKKLAAGYVLGFHSSCLQIFGFLNEKDPDAGFRLIKISYQRIFGDQFGVALFDNSLATQLRLSDGTN